MNKTLELNRLELKILKCLHDGGCIDQYHSMTITELLANNEYMLGIRMTVYRKLRKLVELGFIKKGIIDNHADTFYLTSKAMGIVEERKTNTLFQQKKDISGIPYDNSSVRNKLLSIIDRGLMLKAIAVNAGISESELSRFKNGVDALKKSDVKLLANYLTAVYIPQWNVIKENEMKPKTEKQNTYRDLLF